MAAPRRWRVNTANIPAGSREVYSQVLPRLGWTATEEDHAEADLYCVVTHAGLETALPRCGKWWQRVNRFPGMFSVCEKVNFARLTNALAQLAPEDFAGIPRTLVYPDDLDRLRSAFDGRTFIVKPELGTQGDGIFLVQNAAALERKLATRRQGQCGVQTE